MVQPMTDGDLGIDRIARVAEQPGRLHLRQRLGVPVGIAEALLLGLGVPGVPMDRGGPGVTTAHGISRALLRRDGDVRVDPASRTLVEAHLDDDGVAHECHLRSLRSALAVC